MKAEVHFHTKADLSLPVFGAVAIHLVLGVILLGTWQFSHKKPEEFKIPDSIRAEVVVLEAPAAKPESKPVAKPQPKPVTQPKPKPKPEPKPEPKPVVKETPKPEPKPVAKPPEPAPANTIDLSKEEPAAVEVEQPEVVEPKVEPETPPQSDEDLFENLLAGLAAEEEEISDKIEAIEANQARQAEIEAQVQNYIASILEQVSSTWSRPAEVRLMDVSRLEAGVLVELLPTGELQSVSIVNSSGMDTYDRSVLRAIERVRRFNVPSDSEIFEAGGFRRISITFRPEDLMKP